MNDTDGYSITFDYRNFVIEIDNYFSLSSHTTKYTDPSMIYDFDSVDDSTYIYTDGTKDFGSEENNYICQLTHSGKDKGNAGISVEFYFQEGPAHYVSGYGVFQQGGEPYSVPFKVYDYDDILDLILFESSEYGQTVLTLRSIVINYTC